MGVGVWGLGFSVTLPLSPIALTSAFSDGSEVPYSGTVAIALILSPGFRLLRVALNCPCRVWWERLSVARLRGHREEQYFH